MRGLVVSVARLWLGAIALLAVAQPATAAAGEAPAPSLGRTGVDEPHLALDPAAARLSEALATADTTGTPQPPDAAQRAVSALPELGPEQRRALPDYDGRPEPPPRAVEVAAWVPRLVFLPVRAVLELGVRRPLVAAGTWAERHALPARVDQLLHFDAGRGLIAPRAFADFGFEPHVGLSLRWRDFVDGHDLRAAFSAWSDVLHVRAGSVSRLLADDTLVLHLAGGYRRRPDNVLVPRGRDGVYCRHQGGCRFFSAVADARLELHLSLAPLDRLSLWGSYEHVELAPGERPALPAAWARRLPGFPGYQRVAVGVEGSIDSRDPQLRFVGQSGARLELRGELRVDPVAPQTRFVRYGGEASVFWNVGWNNVLGASVFVALTENLGERRGGRPPPIPVTEKVVFGTLERMPGLREGDVRGNDAWVATLQYVWPIWWALDARLFADLGAAHAELTRAALGDLHLGYGFGVRRKTGPESVLEALVAFGSSRFDRPGGLDPLASVRLAVGVNHGF